VKGSERGVRGRPPCRTEDRDSARLPRRPSVGWARDPQLLHLVRERRSLQAQASCGSTSTSDNPTAFAERSHNLLSPGLLQHIAPASTLRPGSVRISANGTRSDGPDIHAPRTLQENSWFANTLKVTVPMDFTAYQEQQSGTCSFLQVLVIRSNLKQPTPERNGDRVRSVIGPQLFHEVPDVEVNGSLGNCQLIGNLLVAIAISDEPEDVQLPRC
jgi:hypothetical protein